MASNLVWCFPPEIFDLICKRLPPFERIKLMQALHYTPAQFRKHTTDLQLFEPPTVKESIYNVPPTLSITFTSMRDRRFTLKSSHNNLTRTIWWRAEKFARLAAVQDEGEYVDLALAMHDAFMENPDVPDDGLWYGGKDMVYIMKQGGIAEFIPKPRTMRYLESLFTVARDL